jgi:integrase/recombinase XerD
MPLPRLQHQLGHRDIRTTLRYTRWVKNYQESNDFDLLKMMENEA